MLRLDGALEDGNYDIATPDADRQRAEEIGSLPQRAAKIPLTSEDERQDIYSLQPPTNPDKFDALAERGQKIFEQESCAMRHTPPLYTNNKLTPINGSTIPEDHLRKYGILPISLGTDPNLTLKTRRSTGYYKAPSLKGVWYRGMFGHGGWRATLED